jgi:hypothetical protein
VVAAELGIPDHRPIYFSADWDATLKDQDAINAYLAGASSIISNARTGHYGDLYTCQRARDAGVAQWFWQTAAWSGGQQLDGAHIYQHATQVEVGGVSCDVNEALVLPDFGQHPYSPIRRARRMERLPATEAPTDPNSNPATWPEANFDVGFIGPFSFEFGAQEWSGRKADSARAYLYLASWIMPDGSLAPVDPLFTAAGKGHAIADHWPTAVFTAPKNACGLTLNYAAPNGAYVAHT